MTANSQDSGWIVIGRGTHGTVEYHPETDTVCKRLATGDHLGGADARREFDYLQRFSNALRDHQYVDCPRPLRIDSGNAVVCMSYCPGERVDRLLSECPESESCIDHMAEQIAIAVRLYIEEFEEPLFSLGTHNMVYDLDTRVLSVYDFTKSRVFPDFDARSYPLEVSLGCFLAVTTYHTVRPASLTNLGFWNRQRRLSIALMQQLSTGRGLDWNVVESVSRRAFRDLGNPGRRLRTLWYSSAGRVLFEIRKRSILATLMNRGPE